VSGTGQGPHLTGTTRKEAYIMVEEDVDPSIGAARDALDFAASALRLDPRSGGTEL